MTVYTEEYYKLQRDGSRASANEVVPLVLDLIAPKSVVDVGCGTGTWAAAFARHGIEDVLGVDGDYFPVSMLELPAERFRGVDLSQPLDLGRRFDLAVCLEVVEHLSESSSQTIVASLVAAAPVVLFSAAIPEQGGDEHVNEQWPDYWVERFAAHDYVVLDPIRPLVWDHEDVITHYRQNILVFCHKACLAENPRLQAAFDRTNAHMLSVVHPKLYLLVNPKGNEFVSMGNWTRHQDEVIRWYQEREKDYEARLKGARMPLRRRILPYNTRRYAAWLRLRRAVEGAIRR